MPNRLLRDRTLPHYPKAPDVSCLGPDPLPGERSPAQPTMPTVLAAVSLTDGTRLIGVISICGGGAALGFPLKISPEAEAVRAGQHLLRERLRFRMMILDVLGRRGSLGGCGDMQGKGCLRMAASGTQSLGKAE